MAKKKDIAAAAAAATAAMRKTPAQQIIQQAQDPEPDQDPKKKNPNTAPFTVWTTPENAKKWRNYQRAKKDTLPTQAAFLEAALFAYMKDHPVTDAEKAALLESLDI